MNKVWELFKEGLKGLYVISVVIGLCVLVFSLPWMIITLLSLIG